MPLAHIIVPGGEIQVLGDGVMIETVEPAHGVAGDELATIGMGANSIHLVLLVATPGVADKTHPAQQQAGIAVGAFNWNLAPVGIGLAPVSGSPAGVQIVERAVARLQPLLKLCPGIRIEGYVAV